MIGSSPGGVFLKKKNVFFCHRRHFCLLMTEFEGCVSFGNDFHCNCGNYFIYCLCCFKLFTLDNFIFIV